MENLINQAKYLLYVMFVYLNIEIDVFKILMWFMVLDTISGIIKVFRLNYKEFLFKELLWGFVSKIGLLIIPLVVSLLIKGVGNDLVFGAMLVVKIMIVSEFISVISNIYTIKTKIRVKDIDIFTMLFNFLRGSALNLISKYTKIDINEK